MKKVDIRVIGKTEIDMNMLTEKAYVEVDKLFTDYGQLMDYKEYLWRNNKYISITSLRGTNDRQLRETWDSLHKIEDRFDDIANDGMNLKGINKDKVSYYINKAFNSKYYDLTFAVLFGYSYVASCLDSNIISSLCFGYLTVQYGLTYNIKRYTQKLVKGWA